MGTSTGSIVRGLVPTLKHQLGGTCTILQVYGNPSGLVSPASSRAPPSGNAIAYDSVNDQFYKNLSGTAWIKLGSVS